MQPIQLEKVQQALEAFANQEVYLHLETTQGAYASQYSNAHPAGAYIRNARIRFSHGKITGTGPYRVGLKMESGWVYAEGLTDWVTDDSGRLLLAGHDPEGRLAVALQLSQEPF